MSRACELRRSNSDWFLAAPIVELASQRITDPGPVGEASECWRLRDLEARRRIERSRTGARRDNLLSASAAAALRRTIAKTMCNSPTTTVLDRQYSSGVKRWLTSVTSNAAGSNDPPIGSKAGSSSIAGNNTAADDGRRSHSHANSSGARDSSALRRSFPRA
jgi:hypothetical protein